MTDGRRAHFEEAVLKTYNLDWIGILVIRAAERLPRTHKVRIAFVEMGEELSDTGCRHVTEARMTSTLESHKCCMAENSSFA